MVGKKEKNAIRKNRHYRLRKNLIGTAERPRLNVFRSTKHIYVQVIDDATGKTLVAASTMDKDISAKLANGGNIAAAKVVGEQIAKRAIAKGIKKVIFDRGGFLYHGRVASLADAAREAGLEF